MKQISANKIVWGIILIAAAVLLIVDALGLLAPISGVMGEISLLKIALALIILYFIISRLIKGHISFIFIPLSLLFMLFEPNIAYMLGRRGEDLNLISNWLLLLSAIILTIGFSLIFGRTNRKSAHGKSVGALGNNNEYIDAAEFTETKQIENNLGSYNVYFNNADRYNGNGMLLIENNLGETNIYVPSEWKVDSHIENNLGSVTTIGNDSTDGPVIVIRGENNLGSVRIHINEHDFIEGGNSN